MDKKLEDYLETVNKYLNPLSISERTDIINEIKSHMKELITNENLNSNQIIQRLGEPMKLAKAYLGENLVMHNNFNIKNMLRLIKFYGITGFTGVFIVPFTSIMSIALYLSSVIVLIAGLIKSLFALFGYNIPYINIVNFGFWELPAIFSFPVSAVVAVLMYMAARWLWKYLKKYIQSVAEQHNTIKREME